MEPKRPPSSNIASTIFHEMRRRILSGELAPGERLPGERELATEYRTNRNTLREAVRRLEQARLLTVRHGQGVTVADFRKIGTLEMLAPFLESAADLGESAHLLEDILRARLLVLEFVTRLASERADKDDIARLHDLTELVIAAFERQDPTLIGHGFQRWLDALVDATHSMAVRWIANPFLEAYRELIDRFPALWVLEPTFPAYMREFGSTLESGDTERAIALTRTYYQRVDRTFMQALAGVMTMRKSAPLASPAPLDPEQRH